MKIGVLSDTHGLLRPEVLETLEGCDAILHGGDINKQGILDALERIAPVYVVRGNNDREWAEHIPYFLDFELGGLRVYMTHKKRDLPADLSAYNLVVFGHSHRYEAYMVGRTLFLNPGSCGPRRFNQTITLAVLTVENGNIDITRVDIPNAPQKISDTGTLKQRVEIIMKEIDAGRGSVEIALRHHWDPAQTEQIARLYVTHPGVTADGIVGKMGM